MNQSIARHHRTRCAGLVLLGALFLIAPVVGFSQDPRPQGVNRPYVVEYYYTARWGYADEFIRLFKKNHLPVLKKQMEMGRILEVTAAKPRLHSTEDGRWDYRVTIVFKNVMMTNDGFDESTVTRALYPDQETFRKEEQRRFEILLAHWDVPIVEVPLD